MQRPPREIFIEAVANARALRINHREARRVPNLVGEVAIRLNLIVLPAVVRAADGCEHDACRVHAVLVEHIEWINTRPLRLGHAPTLLIQNRARYQHVLKRSFADELHARHHHARNPQEKYIACRDEHGCRVKSFEIIRLIGPAERREGPEPRREPSIEHVRVLRERARIACSLRDGAGVLFSSCDKDTPIFRVPRGNLMPPPELPRNRPIAQVLKPVSINFLVRCFWDEARRLFIFKERERTVAHLAHATEPLRGDERFDNRLATLAARDSELVIFHALQKL